MIAVCLNYYLLIKQTHLLKRTMSYGTKTIELIEQSQVALVDLTSAVFTHRMWRYTPLKVGIASWQ